MMKKFLSVVSVHNCETVYILSDRKISEKFQCALTLGKVIKFGPDTCQCIACKILKVDGHSF